MQSPFSQSKKRNLYITMLKDIFFNLTDRYGVIFTNEALVPSCVVVTLIQIIPSFMKLWSSAHVTPVDEKKHNKFVRLQDSRS